MPKPTTWQRFKSSVGKTLGVVETSASTLDYSLKALELKAFLMRASVITDALNDVKVKETLQNVSVSEEDSENVQLFMQSFRLQNQSTQPSNAVISASNLTRHDF